MPTPLLPCKARRSTAGLPFFFYLQACLVGLQLAGRCYSHRLSHFRCQRQRRRLTRGPSYIFYGNQSLAGAEVEKELLRPRKPPQKPSFCSRRAVYPTAPLVWRWTAGSVKESAHTRREQFSRLVRTTRSVQVPLNCPDFVYRQNGSIRDAFLYAVTPAWLCDIWNIKQESDSHYSFPPPRNALIVAAISPTSEFSGKCIRSICQYLALLSSSLLTIASPVLKTFKQGVKFL